MCVRESAPDARATSRRKQREWRAIDDPADQSENPGRAQATTACCEAQSAAAARVETPILA
jgi:hypothetical protein